MGRVVAVRYGGEDPANKIPSWLPIPAAVACWCGEVNGLALRGGRFFCILHLP